MQRNFQCTCVGLNKKLLISEDCTEILGVVEASALLNNKLRSCLHSCLIYMTVYLHCCLIYIAVYKAEVL